MQCLFTTSVLLLGVLVCIPEQAQAASVKLVVVMPAKAVSTGCTSNAAGTAEPCQYANFRIPGMAAAGGGVLIAAAEGRKMGCGDFGPPPPPGKPRVWGQHDLVIRRSTDSGKSSQ